MTTTKRKDKTAKVKRKTYRTKDKTKKKGFKKGLERYIVALIVGRARKWRK